ncbi:hypothetical protein V1523DRAFT_345717, partial [Lipomyces doorenjongii]
RHKDARSMLCDCPWKVHFKRQLNDSWILKELLDERQAHYLEGQTPRVPTSTYASPKEECRSCLMNVH